MRGFVGFTWIDVNQLQGGRGLGEQPGTEGNDWSFDATVDVAPVKGHLVTLRFRDMNRRDVRRYHLPGQEFANDWTLGSARWRITEPFAGFDAGELRVGYQRKVDTTDWLADPNGRIGRSQAEHWQADLVVGRPVGPKANRLTLGLQAQLDNGESAGPNELTERQNSWPVGPPGERPDSPRATWWNVGVFAHDAWQVGGLTLSAAARLDYHEYDNDPFAGRYYPDGYLGAGPLPAAQAADDLHDGRFVWTGGVGALFVLSDGVSVFANCSRAHRQPAPRFGFTSTGTGVLAPSADLPAPVIGSGLEGGWKFETDKFRGEFIGFYNHYRGFLRDVPGTFNGQDWFDANGNSTRDPGEDLFVWKSESVSWIYGVELEAAWRFDGDLERLGLAGRGWWDGLSLRSGLTWQLGSDHLFDDDQLQFAQPLQWVVGLRWEEPTTRRFWVELAVESVRHHERIPQTVLQNDPGYRRDPADPASGLYRPDGLTGYAVVSLRGAVNVATGSAGRLDITFAVENAGNRRYRRVHSRLVAEGGTNAHVGFRLQLGWDQGRTWKQIRDLLDRF